MTSITITVPMAPDRRLFPNQAGKTLHWKTRSSARRKSREAACAAAEAVKPRRPIRKEVVCTIHADYGYRRRIPDLDATISASKPFLDGLTDAGIFHDDRQIKKIIATHGRLLQKKGGKLPGRTTITIEEVK